MSNDWFCFRTARSKALLLSIGVSLVGQSSFLPALSLGLPSGSSKKTPMQVPGYAKLLSGAGPATNDIAADNQSAQTAPPADQTAAATPSVDLSPVMLSDANTNNDKVASLTPESATGSGVLKSTVQQDVIVPKAPNSDGAMDPISIKDGNIKDKVYKQAKSVNAMPLPLQESPEEASKKSDTLRENEKAQIAELWDATLTRSPEIQFVVQKLMPTNDHTHAATTMMNMLSTGLYGAMGAVNMMSGGSAVSSMGTMMSGQMIAQVLGTAQGKMAKAAKLSETEQIMLFTIIRTTADKLVDTYRSYKKESASLEQAQLDLQDLKEMANEAVKTQDSVKQVEMQYTLKKAQRDVDGVIQDVKRFRQGLIDLAGPDPVAKLDNEFEAEKAELAKQVAPIPTDVPALSDPRTEEAAKPQPQM